MALLVLIKGIQFGTTYLIIMHKMFYTSYILDGILRMSFLPLLYFLGMSMLKDINSKRAYIHFTPALIIFLISIFTLFTKNDIPKFSHLLEFGKLFESFVENGSLYFLIEILNRCLMMIQIIVYTFSIALIMIRSKKKDVNFRIDIKLYIIFILILFLTCFRIFGFFQFEPIVSTMFVTGVFISFFVAFMMIDSLIKHSQEHKLIASYKNNADLKMENAHQIISEMKKSHIFLDPQLSVNKIKSKYHLNNIKYKQMVSFSGFNSINDLINFQRIEFSKNLLIDFNHNLTIDEIAYKSGFYSRATFYRIFKKTTGISPTDFRASNQKSS